MPATKRKNRKNKRVTLDYKHNEKVKYFKNLHKKLPKLKRELNECVKQIREINEIDAFNRDYSKLYVLGVRRDELSSMIDNINNKTEEIEYYRKVGPILYQYYDNIKNVSNDIEDGDVTVSKKSDKSITDFFKSKSKTKISDYIDSKKNYNRAELLNDYLKIMEPHNYVNEEEVKNAEVMVCYNCNIEKTLELSEGRYVCYNCGVIDYVMMDSNKPSFKDPLPEVSTFSYMRKNHFKEWLAQFQAKESKSFPKEIIDEIRLEIKKERITDLSKITRKKIKQYLKKLGYNKYYEHVPYIRFKITGISPPKISESVEKTLIYMFNEIQQPFMEICDKYKVQNNKQKRANFLSYSYVLNKLVELLGLYELKEYFPLLKSRDKLHEQEQIWKYICNKLDWPFIRSI